MQRLNEANDYSPSTFTGSAAYLAPFSLQSSEPGTYYLNNLANLCFDRHRKGLFA